MKRYFLWVICAFMVITSVSLSSWRTVSTNKTDSKKIAKEEAPTSKEMYEQYVADIYNAAHLQQAGLDPAVFHKAITGYINLKIANKLSKNNVITVVDFNKPSHEKRMWIIDVLNRSLLLHTWVSHGQGSGNDMATSFSNTANSHQSSLGFYVTDDVYYGKHGRSLRLDGMDAGFNSSARSRAIVVHAADYVSQGTINQLGRLGRSHGCPAVSPKVSEMVINTIKGKTMLFIAGSDSRYTSKYMDESIAGNYLYPANTGDAAATIASL